MFTGRGSGGQGITMLRGQLPQWLPIPAIDKPIDRNRGQVGLGSAPVVWCETS